MSPSAHPQIQRSLAAIVITDAVGFSKWMSEDEDAALAVINQDLKIITELCNDFEGKILKSTGDGVLMYFISGVQAVSCAIEIQKKFVSLTLNDTVSEHFTHRIGVHLGDIFFNQDDMMGTSVNIAARLESEAKPGAICMSQVVYEVVKYRLKLDAIYAGELSLKNINQSVSAYHVWPPDILPNNSPEQFSEAILSLVTPLNAALKALSSHPQSHRIKKLLYATHHNAWVHNPDVLKNVSLKLLVESLTNRNSSLAECQDSLNTSVTMLPQPEHYTQLAQFILESIKDVYIQKNDSGQISVETSPFQADTLVPETLGVSEVLEAPAPLELSQSVFPQPSPTPVSRIVSKPDPTRREPIEIWNDLASIIRERRVSETHVPIYQVIPETLKEFYAEGSDGSRIEIAHSSELGKILQEHQSASAHLHKKIAHQLDESKDSIRIKQLLYCVCCGQWENHVDRIQAVPMMSLVQGLHQKVSTLTLLQKSLHTILLRLQSRPNYKRAASEIVRGMQSLYAGSGTSDVNRIHFRREKSPTE